jgi:NAD(P)-dependent dehydrogenase (short-subunit alcohol dehydrogenase family)
MKLKDKVAIITGAGSGIGEGIAIRFAREGAKIAIPDIDGEKAERTAGKIRSMGKEALPLQADVSKATEVDEMVRKVKATFGPISTLVNNAGIRVPTALLDLSEEEWNRTIGVNLNGVFLCTQRVVREMVQDNIAGSIVNISSVAAYKAFRNRAAYCASKGGVISFTRAAALELAEKNIRVNAIAPGIIDTPLTAQYKTGMEEDSQAMRAFLATVPLGRWGQPDDIAAAALFLVSDEASYVTGTTLIVDAGMVII